MHVFVAEYCSCCYESGFEIISIWTTKPEADKAMLAHKKKNQDSWPEDLRKEIDWELWRVRKLKVRHKQ